MCLFESLLTELDEVLRVPGVRRSLFAECSSGFLDVARSLHTRYDVGVIGAGSPFHDVVHTLRETKSA